MRTEEQREADRRRQRKSRAKQKAANIHKITVNISENEMKRLDIMRVERAGIGEPYDINEYVQLLIARDWERFQKDKNELSTKACAKCRDPLPGGCGGLFKGDTACFHTHPNFKVFQL